MSSLQVRSLLDASAASASTAPSEQTHEATGIFVGEPWFYMFHYCLIMIMWKIVKMNDHPCILIEITFWEINIAMERGAVIVDWATQTTIFQSYVQFTRG